MTHDTRRRQVLAGALALPATTIGMLGRRADAATPGLDQPPLPQPPRPLQLPAFSQQADYAQPRRVRKSLQCSK